MPLIRSTNPATGWSAWPSKAKTVRAPRTDGEVVHLLAAAPHACQTVVAQRQAAAKPARKKVADPPAAN
jgi:hypothetical protein